MIKGKAVAEGSYIARAGDIIAGVGGGYAMTAVWSTWPDEFPTEKVKQVISAGMTPVLYWQPDKVPFREIYNGTWDEYIQRWTGDAEAIGKKVIVRFAHEMNAPWFSWGKELPADFVRGWRHVVALGERWNIRWFWCPDVSHRAGIEPRFPGIGWVDYVGVDGYAWKVDQSPSDVFNKALNIVRSIAPNKPLFIGEFGVTDALPNEDRVKWIGSAMNYFQSKGVDVTMYFDIDMRFAGHPDWSLTPAMEKKYKNAPLTP